jgi:hypothetical protein
VGKDGFRGGLVTVLFCSLLLLRRMSASGGCVSGFRGGKGGSG